MKSRVVQIIRFSLLALGCLQPDPRLLASQPAQIRLSCFSLQFQPATARLGGQTYTMEITTTADFSEINGELSPLYSDNLPTHGAVFRLQSPVSLDPILGNIAFDQPEPADNNGNGFDDFFEVSQAAGGTAQGLFETAIDRGAVTATWSRAAGSASGTCQLRLTSAMFGQYPVFTHTFQLREFKGTLGYIPGSNVITGTLNLAEAGQAASLLSGVAALTRVATNRFNRVVLLPGSLVTADSQVLLYSRVDLQRDETSRTNYFGYLELSDGDLKTATLDYQDWVLSIDDPNDSNNNGIPDLTDDASSTSARRPTLRLTWMPNQLLLNISGEAGKIYEMETSPTLLAANWSRILSITLTNDPHVVVLPIPAATTQFWRLRGP